MLNAQPTTPSAYATAERGGPKTQNSPPEGRASNRGALVGADPQALALSGFTLTLPESDAYKKPSTLEKTGTKNTNKNARILKEPPNPAPAQPRGNTRFGRSYMSGL